MSQEVVEATCQCLLAQADKSNSNPTNKAMIEHDVIEEFSRCLLQIIGGMSGRSRGE